MGPFLLPFVQPIIITIGALNKPQQPESWCAGCLLPLRRLPGARGGWRVRWEWRLGSAIAGTPLRHNRWRLCDREPPLSPPALQCLLLPHVKKSSHACHRHTRSFRLCSPHHRFRRLGAGCRVNHIPLYPYFSTSPLLSCATLRVSFAIVNLCHPLFYCICLVISV